MIRYCTQPDNPLAKIAAAPRCIRSLEERMADDMREMAFADQNVSVETLVQRGWTTKTVSRFAATARDIARRQSVRQVA
ncbi:hypothetical protein ASD32_04930 [Rhizobium sp. Root483D2]|nr:hypothetical protein ASD32_04930 [Rhizobium sp. Root483D2]